MKEKIKQAAQAYYPKGTLHEVDKVSGFVRGANYTINEVKSIIHKFLQEHDFTTYIDELTMDGGFILDYNKLENDLFKAIEDGHS